MKGPERRRLARVPLRCRVAVREKQATWTAETADVGARGCRITLKRSVVRGALLELRFDCGDGAEPLETVGQVVWTRHGEPLQAGVALLSVPQSGTSASSWIDALAIGQLRRAVRDGPSALGGLEDAVLRLGRVPRAALTAGAFVVVQVAEREGKVSEVPGGAETLATLAALLGDGTVTLGPARPDALGWERALSLVPVVAPARPSRKAAAVLVVPPRAGSRAVVPAPPRDSATSPRATDARASAVAAMIAETLSEEDDGVAR